MYHYVYLLTFDDGMKYLGMTSTTMEPELDTCYLGSGSRLPPRSPETCNKTILKVFTSREEAVAYEIELIDLYDCVSDPAWYNIRRSTFDRFGSKLSEEHIQAISKRQTGRKRPEYSKKYRGKGRTPAQIAGTIRAAEKVRGTKCLAKGRPGIKNNGFVPWYYITPEGEYVEVHDETKLSYAHKLGFTPRQLGHRFHHTNEHSAGKRRPFKGWIFGNLPRPTDVDLD